MGQDDPETAGPEEEKTRRALGISLQVCIEVWSDVVVFGALVGCAR